MRILAAALALLFALCSASAEAFKQYTHAKPIAVDTDMAYLLIRAVYHESMMTKTPAATLVRTLAPGETDPNVVKLDGDDEYTHVGDEWTYLVAVKPGTYVIFGADFGPGVRTSLCLGTVKFEAKPGVITDLGYVLVALFREPTAIPELKDLIAVKRYNDPSPMLLTVRPYREGMPVPTPLAGLPRAPADYRAFAAFPNYLHSAVDRMVPVPDVLDYDTNGHVVDLKALPEKKP